MLGRGKDGGEKEKGNPRTVTPQPVSRAFTLCGPSDPEKSRDKKEEARGEKKSRIEGKKPAAFENSNCNHASARRKPMPAKR